MAASPPEAVRSIQARARAAAEAGDNAGTIRLAEFQARAVRRARASMARWGGALVADAVGMGKTHVALALIDEQLRTGGDVGLVTPAALRRHWGERLRPVARAAGAGVWQPGSGPRSTSARIAWVTHAWLSRNGPVEPSPALMVVDEAHAFRNPATRRYRALAASCVDSRVLLLTATPINNTLLDLHHQIRLFAGDAAFTALGVPSLRIAFRAAASGDWPAPLDAVLAAVVTRRGRAAARGGPAGLRFPERSPPRVVHYPTEGARLAAMLEPIERLELVALDPAGRQAGSHASALVRLLLLKRLESSRAALRATVRRLLSFHERFLEELEQGRLLRPLDHRAIAAEGQLLLGALVLRPVAPHVDVPTLGRAVRADIGRLRSLAAEAEGGDPKARALAGLLAGELRDRRVLVFTEFRETAEELWRGLRGSHRVALVHGGGAWIGAGRAGRSTALALFAPGARPRAAERADVLVATDVLAEGLDLQGADSVVSYDLPWNPVRLIQRVGRIDRLGSPHRRIAIHNFLPADGLDAMLGLLRRLRTKIADIDRGLGREPPVLEAAESDTLEHTLRRIREGDLRLLDDLEGDDGLDRADSSHIAPNHPDTDPFDPASIPVAESAAAPCLMVACECSGTIRWLGVTRADDVRRILRSAITERRPPPPPDRVGRLGRTARRLVLTVRVDDPVPAGIAAAAVRLLLARLAASRDPAPVLLERCQSLTMQLAPGWGVSAEGRLRRILADPPDGLEELCDALESIGRGRRIPTSSGLRILGVIAPPGT